MVTIKYGKNRQAVNEIFSTMTNSEKIHLAGEAGSSRVPKEYVSKEEYGPKGTSIENVIIYKGKTPVSFCDIWANKPGRGYICIGTRGGEEYRGKGYASKALSEAIKLFDKNKNLDELDYYPHKDNIESINLAKKFGFKEFENNEYFVGLALYKGMPKEFSKLSITNESLKAYTPQASQLNHVRVNKNTDGYILQKNGKLAGMVNTERKKDGNVWIQGLELFGDAKGKGYSKNMLDIATKELGATHLSVNKNNSIAKHVYDKYGFEVYDEDGTMYYMKLPE